MPIATPRAAGAALGLGLLTWLALKPRRRHLGDDDLARMFHDARSQLAPKLGVPHRAVCWDDIPVDERLLTAAALRHVVGHRPTGRRGP